MNGKERKGLSKQSSVILEPEILIEEIRTSKREKVGILGGTYNPPHMGHLVMADQVMDQLDLDKILFMPTAQPPHSSVEKKTISSDIRVEMLKLAIQDHPAFDMELYEVKAGGKNYTYDTMKALIDLYPAVDFYFIIGGDMISDLPTWYKIDELVQLVQFVGVKRPGFEKESEYPIIMVDTPTLDISSSFIRRKVATGGSIKYLVPKAVQEFIEKEGLYKNDK
ncbi:MAG TPA: nicotinate-nucleotide adenylyltransferase [Candidatus Atopostipes pullistercoris]|uniref:Probable nicotinate-nucleotide adenylyltransferase n=1 Tax=Candidatus Atopostipes pullistercoris TaxID=2838467 RepID=A0A9D2JXJ4_9LACT|nr:nicotinate-nucleotide adenylyltransferase [Candidatus Atopostipes pullistercoris]